MDAERPDLEMPGGRRARDLDSQSRGQMEQPVPGQRQDAKTTRRPTSGSASVTTVKKKSPGARDTANWRPRGHCPSQQNSMTRSPFRRLVFGTVRRLLYLWVRSETINQSSFTLNLDRSRPVFYALQNPSMSDLAVLDTECRKAGLPRPVLSVAVGNLIEPAAFFYLTPAPDWLGRHDKRGAPPTLERLVGAVTHNATEDAQIIPVSVFWGQSPDKEDSPWKLLFADSWAVTGRLRRLVTILILGRKTRVQFSAPVHVRELVDENKGYERTVRMAQRLLRVHFRNLKTSVIGPDLSHRRHLVKGLVADPLVRQAILDEAAREKITEAKARDKALHYGNEIASDYTYTAIRFLEVVLSWFWNKIYDGIKVSHLEGVQNVAQGNEIIYVPCHRSHIDYLLLSYLLFRNGLTPPHIAAGINLNMPVIGSLLRRGGAFFMRFPVEYFVEGGRSRTGRMLQPKTGMLAITMRSFLRNSRTPIVFVPVYIGYERVLEGRTYLGELRGAAKKKESIFDIFKVIGALKQRFGQVSVNFGEPIKLTEFLDHEQPDWRTHPGARTGLVPDSIALRALLAPHNAARRRWPGADRARQGDGSALGTQRCAGQDSVPGRAECRPDDLLPQQLADGVRRARAVACRERRVPAPGTQLAAFRAADAAVEGHCSDTPALLHGDFPAAQQWPAHVDGRRTRGAVYDDGTALIDPSRFECAGVLRQKPVPAFHSDATGPGRAAHRRGRQIELSRHVGRSGRRRSKACTAGGNQAVDPPGRAASQR
nr:hypothetical protein [Tanacetum cinerariifolium]